MVIHGNIHSIDNGVISGTVNGDVKVTGNLLIKKNGLVRGNISAKNIIIKGKVRGNVYSEGKVYARNLSEVDGNIFAREVIIDKGSIIKGGLAQLQATTTGTANAEPDETALKNTASALENKPQDENIPQSWF